MKSSFLRITGIGSRSLPLTPRRVWLVLLICVATEFAVLSIGFNLSDWPVDKGDEPGYRTLATNILDHGALSLADHAPFEPSVLRAPGYPLFVAFAYLLSGRSVMFLRLLQFGLLGLTGILLFGLAGYFMSPISSLWASILCVTYPPFVFQAAYHLTETLATLLAVLFVYLFVRMLKRTSYERVSAAGIGLVTALAALVRPSFVLLIIFPVLMLVFSMVRGAGLKRCSVLVLLVSLGYLSVIVPCTVRNAYITHSVIPLASSGGWSFCYSMRQYAGEASYRMPIEEWRSVIREYDLRHATARQELSGVTIPQGVSSAALSDALVDHGYARDGLKLWHNLTLGRLIAGVPIRLAYLWSTVDTSPWAAGGPFHLFVQALHVALALLVLGGCYIARGKLIAQWPLWIVPLYLVMMHLIFHVEPRYSLPGRPFLLVYAGVVIERITSLIRYRKTAFDAPPAAEEPIKASI
jgi:4-amino-4-deoxy-L-arabinose transferase-like glycosyltransferase